MAKFSLEGMRNFIESLRSIELSELDLEDIGRWPSAARVIVIVLLFAVVVFVGYYLVLQKTTMRLEQEFNVTEDLKQKYRVSASNAANLEGVAEQVEVIRRQFSFLVSKLPNDTEVPGLLDDISDEGVGNGLDFASIALTDEVVTDIYIELPIKIKVKGAYHNIASFISGVAALPRIVTLHDFDIKPESKDDSVLAVDLTAKTYRYNAGTSTVTVAQTGGAKK